MPFRDKGLADLISERLRAGFENTTLFTVAEKEVAPQIQNTIDLRTQRGQFLGGKLASKGYSTSPLPLFFLGKAKKSGRGYEVSDPTGDRGRVRVPESEIQWGRGVAGQRATAWMIGGYKRFKQLSGRRVDVVNLTWTGELLRQLESRPVITPSGARIETSVYGSRATIAGWLDEKRNFIGLSSPEIDDLTTRIASDLARRI